MKKLGKLVGYIMLGINLFVVLCYLLSAFSPFIDPANHPVLACISLTFPVFLFLNVCFIIFWAVFQRRYTLLSLIAVLITVGEIRTYVPFNFPTKQIPENSIKLLSYNVMGYASSNRPTLENPNPILEYIANSGADIVCLQEHIIQSNKKKIQQEDVDKALSMYPYKVFHKIATNNNGVACYSRFPILFSYQLQYESEYNGSVLYKILMHGDTITVINNHLESNKLTVEDKATYVDMIKAPEKEKVSSGLRLLIKKLAEAYTIRAQQAKVISEVVSELTDETVIVCGDFNDTPVSYTHRVIAKGLDDAFVTSGNGPGVSYNQNGFYFRIDHILISKNLKAYNCIVDRSIKTSDHYPIWCYLDYR